MRSNHLSYRPLLKLRDREVQFQLIDYPNGLWKPSGGLRVPHPRFLQDGERLVIKWNQARGRVGRTGNGTKPCERRSEGFGS